MQWINGKTGKPSMIADAAPTKSAINPHVSA